MINFNQLDNLFYIRHFKLFHAIMVFLLILFYFVMRDFNPWRMDDAWFASFIYNDYVKNIRTDTVFGGDVSTGSGGTQLFGGIYAFVYGSLIQIFGDWTKQTLYVISTSFLLLSSLIWYKILIHFKIEPRYASIICLSFLYIEAFFSAAHYVRVEAFILFLLSVSLMLALAKKYEWSILFSLIAVETHPVGVASFFMNVPLLFEQEHRKFIFNHFIKIAVKVSLALIVFVALYVALHYDYLHRFGELISAPNNWSGNFLVSYYFVDAKYHRHLPEFIFIVISVYFYLKSGLYKSKPIMLHFFLSMLIFSILLNRANFAYVVLVYPAFFLFVFYTFIRLNRFPLLIILMLAFYTPQYLLLSYMNRNVVNANDYKHFIVTATNNNNNLPIVGLPNDYFAFIGSEFYYLCYLDENSFNQQVKEALVIKHEVSELEKYRQFSCSNWNNIEQNYNRQILKTLKYQNKPIVIYKISRKETT